jgi:hypothetical protein
MIALLAIGVALLFTPSCTTMFGETMFGSKPLGEGEMKLVSIRVPESFQEGAPSDVLVNFEANGQPNIFRVCFRWSSVEEKADIPSLYCYTLEATAQDQRSGSSEQSPLWGRCPPLWSTTNRDYALVSPFFCTDAVNISYGEPFTSGSFTARIDSGNIPMPYKSIEGYVEYSKNGQMARTNTISSPVRTSSEGSYSLVPGF